MLIRGIIFKTTKEAVIITTASLLIINTTRNALKTPGGYWLDQGK
jgi:hypothetical protein